MARRSSKLLNMQLLRRYRGRVELLITELCVPEGTTAKEVRQVLNNAPWAFNIEEDWSMEVSLNHRISVESDEKRPNIWRASINATVILVPGDGATVYKDHFSWTDTAHAFRWNVTLPDGWEALSWETRSL